MDGVDALFVGPSDLSASMGIQTQCEGILVLLLAVSGFSVELVLQSQFHIHVPM